VKIGKFLNTIIKNYGNVNYKEIYLKINDNNLIKNHVNDLIKNKENFKFNYNLSWEENKIICFDYINNDNKLPLKNIMYKDQYISFWFLEQKKNIKSADDDLYKILCVNTKIKDYIDNHLNSNIMCYRKTKKLLFNYCNTNNKVPQKRSKDYQERSLYKWLSSQKTKINSVDDELYKKLSKNEYVKKSIDEYLNNKKKYKPTFNELKLATFEYCKDNNKVPIYRDVYKNYNIGTWYNIRRKKLKTYNLDLYNSLTENEIIKTDIDKYLKDNNIKIYK
jgi:hypothetical protein